MIFGIQAAAGNGPALGLRLRRGAGRACIYAVLISSSFLMVFPFLWMLSASLKTDMSIFEYPIRWWPAEPHWENYLNIWREINLPTYFFNTVKVSVVTTAVQLITSSLAAYAFAKLDFPGRNRLFLCYLAALMVPFQVVMVPQFLLVKQLGLANTHLILVLVNGFSPFGVFMLRQFYLNIPNELMEAARIDGLNEFKIYYQIILPLSKTAFISLGVLTFVTVWNDFIVPMVYISSDALRTISLGMRMYVTAWNTNYAGIMAVSVVSLLPLFLVFLCAQRFFVEGIALSGIKG